MRLHRLEVENFRGVRSAALDFAAGVNVLHGPNELGKSTLAEAVRAALLTKPSSTQADTFLRWDGVVPTRVVLTFDVAGEVWRVTKKFSSPSSALLERQVGAQAGKWHTIAQAGHVEGKLRELLGWGMAPPGGKGALSRKESYLVVALLGRQGEVAQILESSLEGDQDDTGKVSITKALGALGSDPRVTAIVDRLSERVDEVFTPTGRLKQTGESPVFRLHQKVQGAVAAVETLRADQATSQAIAATVIAVNDEWLRLSAELREAEAGLKAAHIRHEHDKARNQLQREIDECRATLDQAAQLSGRVAGLRAELEAAVAAERAERATVAAAAAALEGLSRQLQEASEGVVRAQEALARTGLEDEASRQQRRIAITERKAEVQDRLRQVKAAEDVATRLLQLKGDLAAALQAVEASKADQERALAALDHASWSAELSSLVALEEAAQRLQGASDDERRRENAAAAALAHAEADLSAAESRRQHDLDEQRLRLLDAATEKREHASRLEQQAATREVPLAERVAEWRQWETELGAEAPAGRQGLVAWVTAALVAAVAGAVAGTAVFLAGAGSIAAAAAALVVALLAGALAWQRASTRDRAAGTVLERRRLLQDRLAGEVRPALGRANIASLSEFESARDALDEMKARAGRLRVEAGQHDQAAARLAGQGQATLSQAADAAVVAARELRDQKRSLHDQLIKDAAAAQARHDEALRRCDPVRVAQLRTQLAASAARVEVPTTVASAKANLDRARDDLSTASATAEALRRQADDLRPAVEQHLTTLGEDPAHARSKADADLADLDAQLAALDQPSNDLAGGAANGLAAAERRRDELNAQLVEAKANAERAKVTAAAAEGASAEVKRQVALAEGELKAIDSTSLEARLQRAVQDPVFAEPDVPGPDVASASERHELATTKLRECEGRLHEAKGQLRLAGGHAVADRLAQQEEVVEFARQEYEETEQTERAALHLLHQIQAAEAEATSNLGRTLAGPVTEMLKALTGGRYGAVEFATDLTAGGISAAGETREMEFLSVGTKEQIATLVRLAIAAQLQTVLVLDDQLVHSDTERLAWFRERLCASARDRQHQIVVITCRPGDYLPPEGADAAYPVNVVDLTAVVST